MNNHNLVEVGKPTAMEARPIGQPERGEAGPSISGRKNMPSTTIQLPAIGARYRPSGAPAVLHRQCRATSALFRISTNGGTLSAPGIQAGPLLRRLPACLRHKPQLDFCAIGAILGAIFFGWLTDRLGRKAPL